MSNNKHSVTKSELISEIATKAGLSKTQIKDVFEILENIVADTVKSGDSITIPNLCKIYVHKRPATKAREMKSPFNGQLITVSAKPARKVVKVKAVKNLKEMI